MNIPRGPVYQTPSDGELARLVAEVKANQVFTTLDLVAANMMHMLGEVFRPIGNGGLGIFGIWSQEEVEALSPIFYEYLDQADGRIGSNLPTFPSVRIISMADWTIFIASKTCH